MIRIQKYVVAILTFLVAVLCLSSVNAGIIKGAKTNKGIGNYYPWEDADAVWGLQFDAYADIIIKSVKVYNGESEKGNYTGERTFQVLNSSGDTIAVSTVNVVDGEQRIVVNMAIPAGKGYKLLSDRHVGLWRDTQGASYPYSVGNVVSITSGTRYDGLLVSDSYHFFYDWEVEACEAEASFTYSIDNNVVSFTNTTSAATDYLWDFGDNTTSTEKNPQPHNYSDGSYTVSLTAFYAECSVMSQKKIEINSNITNRFKTRSLLKLKIGETKTVTLYDGTQSNIKLLDVIYERDKVRKAIREARVQLNVDGVEKWIVAGNYNLPEKFDSVKVDCPFAKGYLERSGYPKNAWRLGNNDVLLRVWKVDDPVNTNNLIHYHLNQKWAISNTTVVLEPVEEDGDAIHPNENDYIYYHWGVDVVGVKNITEVLAAGDGIVIGVGENYKTDEPIFNEAGARFDRIFIKMPNGWVYRYSHLDDSRLNVTLGQNVKGGDVISYLSDIWGGFAHTHFEIWSLDEDGKYVLEPAYPYLWESYMNLYKPRIIAVARPHKYIAVGERVKLDGLKSVSFEGDIVKYEWLFQNGDTASGAEVYRTYNEPGYFSEILKVTDNKGNIGYETVQVMVVYENQPNKSYGFNIASYYPSFNNKTGEEITFKGRIFNTKSNGEWDYSSETWDFGDGATTISTSAPYVEDPSHEYALVYHTYKVPGHYFVTYSKTTQEGITSTIKLNVDVDGVSSTQKINKNELLIYPNPSAGNLNIELPQAYPEIKISIFNMLGKEIQIYELKNSGSSIKLYLGAKIKNGVYLCKIQAADKLIATKQIIFKI